MLSGVKTVNVDNKLYRMVASCFPPIDFFEQADSADYEILAEIEGLTNDRLRNEVGNIQLVKHEHRIFGPGSTPVMASFTHIGNNNRFNTPDAGAYYAGLCVETAIAETRYHKEFWLKGSNEEPVKLDMRCYINNIKEPVIDLFDKTYERLLQPTRDYKESQAFAETVRESGSAGIFYPSVRHEGGECIVAFRPNALTNVIQGGHYAYVWDGSSISSVHELKEVRI